MGSATGDSTTSPNFIDRLPASSPSSTSSPSNNDRTHGLILILKSRNWIQRYEFHLSPLGSLVLTPTISSRKVDGYIQLTGSSDPAVQPAQIANHRSSVSKGHYGSVERVLFMLRNVDLWLDVHASVTAVLETDLWIKVKSPQKIKPLYHGFDLNQNHLSSNGFCLRLVGNNLHQWCRSSFSELFVKRVCTHVFMMGE